ncbi:MAG: GNAT family N-acetyltransferase [Anaerolineae bacterium]|nr:GNAT family N-acetyltransferase [Anaerolineae bacterium]
MISQTAIDAPEWAAFAARHPAATVFHQPVWAQLLAECYGHRAFALVLSDRSGRVVAGMPMIEMKSRLTGRRWVSLPFTDHCRPLADDPGALNELIRWLVGKRAAGEVPPVEVRSSLPAQSGVHARQWYVIHTLPLRPDAESLLRTFERTHRQKIKQAEKRGLRVISSGGPGDVESFYRLQVETRRKLGVPAQPRRFFVRLWERMVSRGQGHILLAGLGDRAVAGVLSLFHGRMAMIKYVAYDPRSRDLPIVRYAVWKAIEWACEQGFPALDFGRTHASHDGLRDFKHCWRPVEEPLTYCWIGRVPWQPANSWADRLLGAAIRRSPAVVCRGAGELLYAHFG